MSSLILKRAAASRPSGEWNDDDFDVLADGAVVGRIMKPPRPPTTTRSRGIYGPPATLAVAAMLR
jgi:hypothetical protein